MNDFKLIALLVELYASDFLYFQDFLIKYAGNDLLLPEIPEIPCGFTK